MHRAVEIFLLGTIGALALSQATLAAPEGPADATGSDASDSVGEVVVTGSRLVTDGSRAPTPVTVAPVAELEKTVPSSIPDALKQLPIFQGSTSTANVINASAASTGNYLNLRNFGIVRTLILEDGIRVPPTNYNGQVDTNIIPQMLVQRVDVVTGGASAVYGSDAVTGVVNFVLDKKFEGIKAVAQGGISEHHDAESYRVGIAAGTALFGDRAHILASVEQYQNKGIPEQTDRAYGRGVYIYDGAGTASNPYRLVGDARFTNTTQGGLVTSGPFAGQQFGPDGQLAPFTKGTLLRNANLGVGGDGAYYTGNPQNVPQKTTQGFVRGQFDFSDSLSAFIKGGGTQTNSDFVSNIIPLNGLRIYSGNPFLPASAQAQLDAANVPSFTVNRISSDLGNRSEFDQTTKSIFVTAGLDGKLGKYTWQAYATHGDAQVNSQSPTNINWPRFYAAADAVKDSNGNTVCNVTLSNPGLYPGCVPINLFGQNAFSQASFDYISGGTFWNSDNKMNDFGASIAGNLFDAWAGPISGALNAEYRHQSLDLTSNASPLIPADFTGLRGVPTSPLPTGGNWRFSTVAPQHGANNVSEVGTEFEVPLVNDAPLIKSLSANVAGRYTHYATGGVETWKAGIVYEPYQDLRLRAVTSRDIRAPTLYDLYAGRTIQTANLNDSHTGVNGIIPIFGGGNPNLVPEVARTTTAGFVFSPSWLPRFTLSLDYFHIYIKNAIGQIAGNNIAVQNECANSNGTSPVCATIVRPLPYSDTSAANFPTNLLAQTLNIASVSTHGLDLEASYGFGIGAAGDLNLRLLATYQPTLTTQSFPNSPIFDAAGTVGVPQVTGGDKERATLFIDHTIGRFTTSWLTRYSGKLSRNNGNNSASVIFVDPPLPGIFFNDVNFNYVFGDKGREANVFFNIGNVFDKQPRISPGIAYAGVPGVGSTTPVQGDDDVGRYFTLGVRLLLK